MDAVRVRVEALVRRGWPATVILALLVGLAAGAAMATVAAARRTSTAYDRLQSHAAPPQLNLTFCPPGVTEVDETTLPDCFTYRADAERDLVAGLPVVEAAATGSFRGAVIAPQDEPSRTLATSVLLMQQPDIQSIDGEQVVLDGRWYDGRAAEVVLNDRLAERTGLGVGDEVRLTFWGPDDLGLQARPGETYGGPATSATVVGISRGLLDLMEAPGEGATAADDLKVFGGAAIEATALAGPSFGGVFVRGSVPDAELLAAIERAFGDRPFSATPALGEDERAPVREAISYEAGGVLAAGALAALAALVVTAQTVARQSRREWAEADLLRAVGFTQGQVAAAALLRAATIAVPAAVVATVTAIALSPLGPVGLARQAEVDRGVAVDALVVAGGVVAVVAAVLLSGWVPVRRGRLAGRRRGPAPVSARETWLPPPLAAGLRLGRRDPATGLPLGTAVAGVALAAGAVAAATGLTASLDALQSTPERYGAPWDVSFGGVVDGDYSSALDLVVGHPDVEAGARLVGTDASVGDVTAWVHAFEGIPGIDAQIAPPITSGRAPAAVDEIALGTVLLDDLGLEVGDRVAVRSAVTGSVPTELTIVGTTMINDVFENSPGRGGLVTAEWVARAAPEVSPDPYVVRLVPGADADAFRADLREVFRGGVNAPVPQTAIRNVARIRQLPYVLAAFVALLATAAFAHGLVLSVRRHHRQLAVLRALGFTGRQVAASVASHATALAVGATAVGVPLGVVLGRWGWRAITHQLGVVDVPTTPLVPLLLIGVAVVIVSNLVAAVPMWRASRLQVAAALRAE